MAERYTVHHHGESIPCERRGNAPKKFIFTHGAMGGLETAEMTDFADGVSNNHHVISFEGSVTNMQSRLQAFSGVINFENDVVAIGGRSMGSRAAALTATHASSTDKDVPWAKQLVLVSFPLVGKQRGDNRAQVILDLPPTAEVLFVSGDRDRMCDLEKLNEIRTRMKACSWLLEVSGASHTLQYQRRDEEIGKTMRQASGRIASDWLLQRDHTKLRRRIEWNEDLGQIDDSGWN